MANHPVFATVANKQQAEKIVGALINEGIHPSHISILCSSPGDFKELKSPLSRNWRTEQRIPLKERETPTPLGQVVFKEESALEDFSKAPEGATAGAATGGIIGGALGLLIGIGALTIPGLGPLIAIGPLMAALSGIGAGGTLGGILGALIGAGIPEKEAQHFLDYLHHGGIILSVEVDQELQAQEVIDILHKHGVTDIAYFPKGHFV